MRAAYAGEKDGQTKWAQFQARVYAAPTAAPQAAARAAEAEGAAFLAFMGAATASRA